MLVTGQPPVRRRPSRNNRAARIAIPVTTAVTLSLGVGIFVAASSGGPAKVHQAAASSSQGVSSSAVNTDCDIVVPAHPLTAKGLATPYQLTGPAGTSPADSGCQMINSLNLGAFVQATILNPATGALSVYDPLVITKGTKPAVRPVVPKLPAHAVVTIDIGFNGAILRQVGATPGALSQGRCTDGEPGSPFGQVSFCNGPAFFKAAFAAERAGRLTIPSAGISRTMVATAGALGTGHACPTVRNFDMVDQDPSDNVTTTYLLNPATGRTAQYTAANRARMRGAKKLVNGSDNALIDDFLDPALGCAPLEAPDLGNHGVMTTSQALDELLAARNEPKNAALIPENDGMVVDNAGAIDLAKTNLYRSEIGQPLVSGRTQASSSPQMFCQNLVNIQTPFIAANEKLLAAAPSPVPTVGDTLYTFLANRLAGSFDELNCKNFGLTQSVVGIVTNGAGAATQVTLNTAVQTASF
ncbi:MAG TPA: hypothetical protein VMK84_19515 [Streptosporangiaceae bacterium]|nr:hypothetical protein [Streptosporangiaceae bacterium]